ncbi:saccharopine dehydrogenase NADP-binding domain-containing protein [Parvibaculum sp.]|uniref:saccharopine dehydrogenase NADP-binding domain-containing protein n=1 Tax=Parvibaculum sp. TaxID=2024848 RepID=UPI0032EF52D5
MKSRILIYGVDGFMGALASRAAKRGRNALVAAGRYIAGVAQHEAALAKEAGTTIAEPRTFTLGDKARIAAQLDDVGVVVNCMPLDGTDMLALLDACIDTETHYIDVTSERAHVAALAAHDEVAKRAKTMVMAGAGFDYAAVDAVAERLAQILRGARAVTIAVKRGPPTLAEAERLVAALGAEGETVKNGQFVPAKAGERTLEIDFGEGPEVAHLAPWRGEATGARHRGTYSSIESYEVLPERAVRVLEKGKLAARLFARGWGVKRLERKLSKGRLSPTAADLKNGRAAVWGEARSPDGGAVRARLETPQAHLYSAEAAVLLARRALQGAAKPGFQLPFAVAGAALIEEIPGTHWREIADPEDDLEPEPAPALALGRVEPERA